MTSAPPSSEVDALSARFVTGSPDRCESSGSSCATPGGATLRTVSSFAEFAESPNASQIISKSIWESSFWGRSFTDETPPPTGRPANAPSSSCKSARNSKVSRITVRKWLENAQTLVRTPAVAPGSFAHSSAPKVGHRRRVYDQTYYIGELRNRCRQLKDEISCLYEELEGIQNSKILASSLAKRKEMAKKRRDKLKGSLKDHVLVLDHLRCGTTQEELQDLFSRAKAKNEVLTCQLDRIFLERKALETEARHTDLELEELELVLMSCLGELPRHEQEEYKQLSVEDGRLSECLRQARHAWLEAVTQSEVLEKRLHAAPLCRVRQQLIAKRQELSQHLSLLRDQLHSASLSPAEQREALLNQVRCDNAEIVTAGYQNREFRLQNEILKDQLQAVDTSLESAAEQLKFDALAQKDKDMTNFIESFDEKKAFEEQRLRALEGVVVQLLSSMSRCLPGSNKAADDLDGMRDDLGFHQKQLRQAEETHNRLSRELVKRQRELEQFDVLEQRLASEFATFNGRISEYEAEIENKFHKIGQTRQHAESLLMQLCARKERLQERAHALRLQAKLFNRQLEKKHSEIADHPVAEELAVQEDKIQQLRQTALLIGLSVQNLTNASDFSEQEDSCTTMASDINKITKAKLKSPGL